METVVEVVLPDELISEILLRLPVISLLRFKCVSKSWNSLISHPNFITLYLQISPNNAKLILTVMANDGQRIPLSCSVRSLLHQNLSSSSSTNVVAENLCYRLKLNNHLGFGVPCNGLICLVRPFHGNFDDGDGFHNYRVRLWNPVHNLFSKTSPYSFVKVEGRAFDSDHNLTQTTYKVVGVLVDATESQP